MSLSESPGIERLSELEAEYEIISELGRGGSSIVYLAREKELNRDVAIKVVRSNQLDDPEAVARLAREAKLVALLRHPNIVPLLSTRHLSDGSLALVMQHVPGHTLKSAIRQAGRMPIAVVEHVLREVGSALDYAHRRHGVVHRDIKPENIYLDEECGRALLSDFGIARPGESDSNLTLAGTALGTPAYMSPEQIDGVALDARSDLYSLGLVAYEMLTGQQPWAGCNLYTIIYKQKHEDLPPLASVRNDIPAYLERAIAGLLHKARDSRWADAAQFLAQLPVSNVTPDLAVTPREAIVDEPVVSEDTPTLRYRRDEVEEHTPAKQLDVPAEIPWVAASTVPAVPEEPPIFEEKPVPRRRPAPGRSYAVPDAPPVMIDASGPTPLPAALTRAEVVAVRRHNLAQRALTFAHITHPRSRMVAATTAILVLGASATVVATMNRGKEPEFETRGGVLAEQAPPAVSPASASMAGVALSSPLDTVAEKTTTSSDEPSESERIQEKASAARTEREESDDAEKAEKSDKPSSDKPAKEEESPKPAPEPSRSLAKSLTAAVTPPVEPPATAVRDSNVPTNQPSTEKPAEIDTAPVFTPYTVKPELRNRSDVQRSLSRYYPRRLREAGVGGVVMLWALIDESGKVAKAQLKDPSGVEVLDQAALKVAESMRFTPALNRDQKVRVWIELPLVFKAE